MTCPPTQKQLDDAVKHLKYGLWDITQLLTQNGFQPDHIPYSPAITHLVKAIVQLTGIMPIYCIKQTATEEIGEWYFGGALPDGDFRLSFTFNDHFEVFCSTQK